MSSVIWFAKVFVPALPPDQSRWPTEKGMRYVTLHFGTNLTPTDQPTFSDGTSASPRFVIRPAASAEDMAGGRMSRKLPGAWVPRNLLGPDESGGLDYTGFGKEKKPRWRR